MEISEEAFELANKRAGQQKARHPAIVSVRFDRDRARLIIELDSGIGLTVPPERLPGLENAAATDLETAEVSPSGLGLFFPKLDADIYLPALLEDLLATSRWAAARTGKAGGKATTEAKAAAARENGKRGGRPRKSAPDESSAVRNATENSTE